MMPYVAVGIFFCCTNFWHSACSQGPVIHLVPVQARCFCIGPDSEFALFYWRLWNQKKTVFPVFCFSLLFPRSTLDVLTGKCGRTQHASVCRAQTCKKSQAAQTPFLRNFHTYFLENFGTKKLVNCKFCFFQMPFETFRRSGHTGNAPKRKDNPTNIAAATHFFLNIAILGLKVKVANESTILFFSNWKLNCKTNANKIDYKKRKLRNRRTSKRRMTYWRSR